MKQLYLAKAIAMAALSVAALSVTVVSCKKKPAAMPDEELTVSVAEPEVDSVTLTRTYPGFLIADRKVDLVARVNGYLRDKCYQDGQYVGSGAVLFRIEDTQYRDAVAQAEAQLRTAKATYEYNSRNYEAMKKALLSDAVSQMSVAQAESDMKNSLAAIHNAEAALEAARTTLGYCTVRAPFGGHVSAPVVSVGAYLSGAGAPVTLATIYEDATIQAVFNIEDSDFLAEVKKRSSTSGLNFSAIPLQFNDTLQHNYTGNLFYVAPDVDSSTGTLVLKASVDNPYGELKAGMYATITLPYKKVDDAILVKDASIGTDQAGKYLYVVNDSSRVVYTPIKVGDLVNDSMRLVTSGLTPHSRYVTQALLKVRDGMKVKTVTVK